MNSTINVLHLSTHNEECGIAIFQQNIVDGMGQKQAINNVFFDLSPNKLKLLKGKELDQALKHLFKQLKDFDILHIQHEYSFYNDNQLQRIVNGAKAQHKKVLFTLHTPPHALGKDMPKAVKLGLHPRSWLAALYVVRQRQKLMRTHLNPMKRADLLIVTSQAALKSFASFGLQRERMRVIELPVPKVNAAKKTDEISQALHKQDGDIILSTTGFITKTKGMIAAIKSLTLLPANYKLAIIGGSHPSGQNDKFYEKACDLIRDLKLNDRVYITGYVAEDDQRDALLRETDICIYPYDKDYYNYVSSAALTNAIANSLPIVAYQTDTFLEANKEGDFISFCHSAVYYELARTIKQIDIAKSIRGAKQYATTFSVENQAGKFAGIYADLAH